MADEELDQGAEPEALNVVRLPRDWLGPREALVPLIPLAGGRSAVADVDGEPVSERRRSQHPGASPPRSVGDAPEAPHLRSVGGIAPPLEEPKGVLSADAFWVRRPNRFTKWSSFRADRSSSPMSICQMSTSRSRRRQLRPNRRMLVPRKCCVRQRSQMSPFGTPPPQAGASTGAADADRS